ncbi:MAG TPA: thiamine phosphate synthase [Pirellulaceae bacterium]|nr:thiamine phosphate synthase [Pirellulaceae bacterium]
MADSSDRETFADRLLALRIVDANFNRASEGLRVVEEYCRFAAGDAHLSRLCKELRHDLTQVVSVLPAEELAQARQTERDVGTTIATPSEGERQSLADVAVASLKRLEQALRAIEEYGKLLPPLDVARVEQLRYRAYTVGKAIVSRESSLARLAQARLYVLIDGGGAAGEFNEAAYAQRVEGLATAGVHVLQLRDHSLDDRALLSRAKLVRQITRGTGTLLILNDRADLAAACQADGVHLGQDDLPVYEARQIVGSRALIGVSTHTIEQARQAVLDGADYLGCGPTFPSTTKHFDQFPGLPFLRAVAAEITLPAFAIGGITAENLPQVAATGMKRVALSGGVWNAGDSNAAARRLLELLTKAGPSL